MAPGRFQDRDPWAIGAVVLLIAAIAFMAVALVVSSNRTRPTYDAARASAANAAAEASEAASQPSVVAFLGDSYTVGTGADAPERGYAPLTAQALGARPIVAGQGGTGYVSNGNDPEKAPFTGRVSDVAGATLVVVEGSVNDRFATPAEIQDAAAAVFDDIKAATPEVRIVALGAPFTPDTEEPRVQVTKDSVAAAAAAAGVVFIDPAGWLDVADDSLWSDGVHPSQVGHEIIANRLAQQLETVLAGQPVS